MTKTPTRPWASIEELADAELIRRSLDDPECFELLFTRHARAVFGFASVRVGPDRAEDVTAETFAAAFRSRANFDLSATSARPWLFGIAANTLRRHSQHEVRWLHRPRLEPVSADPGDGSAASDERLDAGRLAPRLAAALAELTPGERDVLLLHVLGDLTHQKIAIALGIRRGTAKSRLSRGRARLRATFPELDDHLNDHARGGNHD